MFEIFLPKYTDVTLANKALYRGRTEISSPHQIGTNPAVLPFIQLIIINTV